MSRSSDRITHRVVEWWIQNPRWAGYRVKPIHAVVSVPIGEAERLKDNYRRLRDVATIEVLKSGLIGGAMIFHPYRHKDYGNETLELENQQLIDLKKGWYYSPHFHVIGFGWIDYEYQENGWIVKNLGVRGDTPKQHRIFELARYQLSHCGVNSKYHTITWVGQLSAHKFKAPPMPLAGIKKCDECGSFFYPVTCDHVHTFDKEGLYSVDPPGWRYVATSGLTTRTGDRTELRSIYEDVRYG